jgi:alkanesulfonate monooxygenase SsuD/methylene tetrahydromethanopterin reductase-like flavin-dependent oxidoreductase (luciferase family)
MLDEMLAYTVVGTAPRVRDGLREIVARTGADELMLASQIHDHRARLRSYEITAGVRDAIEADDAVDAVLRPRA